MACLQLNPHAFVHIFTCTNERKGVGRGSVNKSVYALLWLSSRVSFQYVWACTYAMNEYWPDDQRLFWLVSKQHIRARIYTFWMHAGLVTDCGMRGFENWFEFSFSCQEYLLNDVAIRDRGVKKTRSEKDGRGGIEAREKDWRYRSQIDFGWSTNVEWPLFITFILRYMDCPPYWRKLENIRKYHVFVSWSTHGLYT